MKPAADRVRARSHRTPGGCLVWTGATFRKGYGNVRVQRPDGSWANKGAHIVMYEDAYGPVPEGLYVCHSCDNPPCVEPAHLYAATQKQNLADMTAKGRRRTVSTATRNPLTGRYERPATERT